uniref:Uncharacterized protein n=1 Tax=Nelumbo nucifera TaxID=4432 RepID=A0A822XQW2_NELNU|nr:TPA_asm: hypothetical protein HUJ06_025457 [Nelumbo nucifera]
MFSDNIPTPPVRAPPFRTGAELEGTGAGRPKHEHQSSREDADFRRLTDSPARHDTGGRRVSSGETAKKPGRPVGTPDRSVEHSPLHPHYQARVAGRTGVASPSWERKGSSDHGHGLAPLTPGRSQPRSRGDETVNSS